MKFLKKLERKLSRYVIRGIINYVYALQASGIVLYLTTPRFLFNYLMLNPAAIIQGQIWGIFTFLVFTPAFTGGSTTGFILFNVLALYCVRTFGMIVKQVWGKFCFNCYVILGVLLNAIVSLMVYPLSGSPLTFAPIYLVYSFSFVFVLMFPESQILLIMVLPLKAKRIAVAEAVIHAYNFYKGGVLTKVEILVCVLHVFTPFGWMVVAGKTSYKQKKRQKEFQKGIKPMTVVKTGHRRMVCEHMNKDSPGMKFRYCSECEDSCEYCTDHLHTHQHVKKSGPPS